MKVQKLILYNTRFISRSLWEHSLHMEKTTIARKGPHRRFTLTLKNNQRTDTFSSSSYNYALQPSFGEEWDRQLSLWLNLYSLSSSDIMFQSLAYFSKQKLIWQYSIQNELNVAFVSIWNEQNMRSSSNIISVRSHCPSLGEEWGLTFLGLCCCVFFGGGVKAPSSPRLF